MNNNVMVWTIKDNYRLGSDIQSKVLAFAFGLSAEIERNLISQRTKEALNKSNIDSNRLVVKTISHASSDTDNIVISANEICDPSKGVNCLLDPNDSYTIGIAESTWNYGNENYMDFSVSRTINFEFQQHNSY